MRPRLGTSGAALTGPPHWGLVVMVFGPANRSIDYAAQPTPALYPCTTPPHAPDLAGRTRGDRGRDDGRATNGQGLDPPERAWWVTLARGIRRSSCVRLSSLKHNRSCEESEECDMADAKA